MHRPTETPDRRTTSPSPMTIASRLLSVWHTDRDTSGPSRVMTELRALPVMVAAAVAVEMHYTLTYDRQTHPRPADQFRRMLREFAAHTVK